MSNIRHADNDVYIVSHINKIIYKVKKKEVTDLKDREVVSIMIGNGESITKITGVITRDRGVKSWWEKAGASGAERICGRTFLANTHAIGG